MKALGPYIPILRPKAGELKALKELSKSTINKINPFFDFHKPPLIKSERKPFDEHIENICNKLINHWPARKLLFFDLYFIDLKKRMKDSSHPLSWICQFFREKGYQFIPTIGTERDGDYAFALRSEIQKGLKNGICIRLLNDDLEMPEETFNQVQVILENLGISSSKCHLLVDFKYIETSKLKSSIESLTELRNYTDFSKWNSLIVSGSGFPQNMSNISSNTIEKIPRVELKLWKLTKELYPLLGTRPLYSDYCIVSPETPDVDPKKIRPVGKIRYATKDSWVIFRGNGLHKYDRYKQYFRLAKKVVRHRCYLGSKTSWGDNHYKECSKRNTSCGNLTTWIKVDTNHHLTIVAKQIFRLSEL